MASWTLQYRQEHENMVFSKKETTHTVFLPLLTWTTGCSLHLEVKTFVSNIYCCSLYMNFVCSVNWIEWYKCVCVLGYACSMHAHLCIVLNSCKFSADWKNTVRMVAQTIVPGSAFFPYMCLYLVSLKCQHFNLLSKHHLSKWVLLLVLGHTS